MSEVRISSLAAVDDHWRTGREIYERVNKWAIRSVNGELFLLVKSGEIEMRKATNGYVNEYRLTKKANP